MLWIDLQLADTSPPDLSADACVVGAGAAGLYIASQLVAKGRSVVVVEAGPRRCVDTDEIGFRPRFEAQLYAGATQGRLFGVGGSTASWGGQLVPHTAYDLRDEEGSTDAWKHIVESVTKNSAAVLQRLGGPTGESFESFSYPGMGAARDALDHAGLTVMSSMVMPFRSKNLHSLLGSSPAGAGRLTVLFNAVVGGWHFADFAVEGAFASSVQAISANGHRATVVANRFVVAAGAIESARLLLEINDSGSRSVLKSSAVGCYLADHLSIPIADVQAEDRTLAGQLFAPWFSGGWMRSVRFLDRSLPAATSRAFAHFIFPMSSAGFVLAKAVLGGLQRRRLPLVSGNEISNGISELGLLAWSRFAKGRLYIAPDAPVHLQLDMEQTPLREHSVRLTMERDNYGRRRASIQWAISASDIDRMAAHAEAFIARWPGRKRMLPDLVSRMIAATGTKPHDAYHPVGTCRMGTDIDSVVDLNLKARGTSNVWVVSTGVLPSAGSANPTFTMLCLAHRLGEQL